MATLESPVHGSEAIIIRLSDISGRAHLEQPLADRHVATLASLLHGSIAFIIRLGDVPGRAHLEQPLCAAAMEDGAAAVAAFAKSPADVTETGSEAEISQSVPENVSVSSSSGGDAALDTMGNGASAGAAGDTIDSPSPLNLQLRLKLRRGLQIRMEMQWP